MRDEVGKPILSTLTTSGGGSAILPGKDYQNLGLIVGSVDPGYRGRSLTTVDVILRYSDGEWKPGFPVKTGSNGVGYSSLDDHAFVSGVGQTPDGKAFLTVTRNDGAAPKTQFAFTAETRSGEQVSSVETANSGPVNMLSERVVFPTPLSNVKQFVSRQRKIRTIEFKNVSLQVGRKTEVQVVASGTPSPDAPLSASLAPVLSPTFCPVIERTVNDPRHNPRDSAIDLDSGKLFSDPSKERRARFTNTSTSIREFASVWAPANGIDAVGVVDGQPGGTVVGTLGGIDLFALWTDATDWDKVAGGDRVAIV